MSKIKALFLTLTLLATSLVALPQAVGAAGSASLSLSPAGGGHNVGTTFAVTVIENSGATAVNGVEADLSYDSSKLQFLGKSCGGGFEITAPAGGSNLACATVTAKTGGQAVGTLSFKAIAAGSGAISFLPSSQITASDGVGTNVWNGATGGGSYSLVTPVAAPRPRAAAASTTTQTPAPTPTPVAATETPKAVVTKPKVAVVATTAPKKNAANTFMWLVLAALLIGALVAAVEYMPKRKKAEVAGADAASTTTKTAKAKKPAVSSKKKVAVATLAVGAASKTTKKSVKKPTTKKTK